MRYLYHLVPRGTSVPDRYASPGFDREGFIHASYRDAVIESASLYFPPEAQVVALQIDPRRLDVPVDVEDTKRGPMPHIRGSVPRDAVRATLDLGAIPDAPDRVTGTRIAFVAFEGMTLLDLVGALDPVSRIATMGFDPETQVEVVGATGHVAWSLGGSTFRVDSVRPPLDRYDVLVVPGGYGTRVLERDEGLSAWLSSYPANRILASVCTGSLLLGAAGRLAGKRATSHASAIARLAEYGALPSTDRVVDEGQLITAGGVTAALDLGLHLVRRLAGSDVAEAIARQMEMPLTRG